MHKRIYLTAKRVGKNSGSLQPPHCVYQARIILWPTRSHITTPSIDVAPNTHSRNAIVELILLAPVNLKGYETDPFCVKACK